MVRLSKKASMQLSINAIVVVILAFTMLGLGLTFIKGQIDKMSQTSTGVQQQLAEQIEEQMRSSGDKISFQAQLEIQRNKQEGITLGVQNTGNTQLNYRLNISIDESNSDTELVSEYQANMGSMIRYPRGCLNLETSEAAVHNILIKAPSKSGILALKAEIQQYSPNDADCNGIIDGGSGSIIPGYPITYANKLSYLTIG